MPFPRPTLNQIIDRILGDIDAFLPGADSRLKRSVLNVFGIVIGGTVHLVYGFIEFLSQQLFVDQAETEFLDRWAAFWGLERLEATFANGPVEFTGVNDTVIPIGTAVQRIDDAVFTTDQEVTIIAGTANAFVTAVIAGVAGNTADATVLTMSSPVAGVDEDVTVKTDVDHPNGIEGGLDEEGDEPLRERILLRVRTPPQGGAEIDYETQAREVPGVTRVFVRALNRGLGTVDVFFTRDDDGSGAAIIPGTAEVQEVQDFIDPLRPVTANFLAVAPIALLLDMTVSLEPNLVSVQASAEAEIEDMLFRNAEPGDGVTRGTIFLSQINEAISVADGEDNHIITLINGSPPADVVPGPSEIVVIGTITWEDF